MSARLSPNFITYILSETCLRLVGDLFKTRRRPGRRHVLSRFKAGFRQDRCNGILALWSLFVQRAIITPVTKELGVCVGYNMVYCGLYECNEYNAL